MNLSGYINCDLCGKKEDEKSIHFHDEGFICIHCYGAYDDQELKEEMEKIKNEREEELGRKKNQWEWESLKIEIKDPNGKIHILNSGDIGDFCLSALFDEITTYVTEKKGVLK